MSKERIQFSASNPDKDIFVEVDLRARKRLADDPNRNDRVRRMTYGQAVQAEFTVDRDLCEEYVNTIPPAHRRAQ